MRYGRLFLPRECVECLEAKTSLRILKRPPDLTLTTLGQVLALFVILVPLCGYLGFTIFFYINNRMVGYDDFNIAIERSIPSLSIVGGAILLLALFTVFLRTFRGFSESSLVRIASQDSSSSPHHPHGSRNTLFSSVSAYFVIAMAIWAPIYAWSYSKWSVGNALSFMNLGGRC